MEQGIAHTYDPMLWEGEAERSQVQAQSWEFSNLETLSGIKIKNKKDWGCSSVQMP